MSVGTGATPRPRSKLAQSITLADLELPETESAGPSGSDRGRLGVRGWDQDSDSDVDDDTMILEEDLEGEDDEFGHPLERMAALNRFQRIEDRADIGEFSGRTQSSGDGTCLVPPSNNGLPTEMYYMYASLPYCIT